MTAVSMVFIAEMLANFDGNIEKALPTILSVFLLAGLLQIVLGFMGLGKYIRYIPYPVVSGFMTAIGVIILVTQIAPTLGYYAKEDSAFVAQFKPQAEEVLLENILHDEVDEGILVLEDFETTIARAEKISEADILLEAETLAEKHASGVLGTLKVLPRIFAQINSIELILALLTIAIIYGFKRITTAIPSTLVALLIVSGGAFALGVDYRPIAAIPSGLPLPQWGLFAGFGLDTLTQYIFTAMTLALFGCIDSLLTSVVADNMTKTGTRTQQRIGGTRYWKQYGRPLWGDSRSRCDHPHCGQYQVGRENPFIRYDCWAAAPLHPPRYRPHCFPNSRSGLSRNSHHRGYRRYGLQRIESPSLYAPTRGNHLNCCLGAYRPFGIWSMPWGLVWSLPPSCL